MTAWKENQDAQFFINMGDLVDNGEDHTQWNLWFEAVENIISAIPIAPVMGNHGEFCFRQMQSLTVIHIVASSK